MSITLNFELNDRDLEHFTRVMEASRKAAESKTPEQVIDAAGALLVEAQKASVPDFILERLVRLDDLISMVRDNGWALPDVDRQRVLAALTYFADPKDVIPDNVEVLGFLDDAIMIELCVRELRHELEAYDDFCDFRQREAERRGVDPASVGHADWLDSRREELVDRMHTRRERDFGVGYGSSSGYGPARSYNGRAWRPGTFKFR